MTADLAVLRATALLDLHRPDEAIEVLGEALRVAPHHARAMAVVGLAHLAADRRPLAREWCERAIGADPADPWIHHVRAIVLLGEDGRAADAVWSAGQAVRAEPESTAYLLTLARAHLSAGDRAAASDVAARLRRVDPAGTAADLAETYIALHRSDALHRGPLPLRVVVATTLLTSGLVLPWYAAAWVVRNARAAPHLRRADRLLSRLLQEDPGDVALLRARADVLDRRLRVVGSVRAELSAASADVRSADAAGLARRVATRTAWSIVVALGAWVLVVASLDGAVTDDRVVAAAGGLLGLAAVAGVAALEHGQALLLPPPIRARLHRRWSPIAAAAGAAAWTTLLAWEHLRTDGASETGGYQLAGLLVAPAVLAGLVVLLVRAVRSLWAHRR